MNKKYFDMLSRETYDVQFLFHYVSCYAFEKKITQYCEEITCCCSRDETTKTEAFCHSYHIKEPYSIINVVK